MTQDNPKNGINYIYDYVNRIERSLVKLREINTFNSNKIIEFHKELVINSMSEATQTKYLDRLILFLKWVNKDFDKLTKQDLIDLIDTNLTQNNNYSKSTKSSYRIIVRRFFQWFKGSPQGEYPIEVSWMRGGMDKSKNQKNPEDMLSDEDIEKMVNATAHPRNKAFIITLAESGCRIGEILTLTIKKICFDNNGCFFKVKGKTGERRVRVVNATPYLHAWLNVHPNKEDPDAPLFINVGTTQNINNNLNENNNYKMQWKYCMSYAAARKLLQVAAKKAGITKPINPHNFRHSRATKLCSLGISGNILNEYFGWTQASRSVSTYLHLSGKQVDDTLLNKAYGMATQESNPQPKMFPIKCFSCGELNSHNVSRCKRCNTLIGSPSNDDLEEQKNTTQLLKLFGEMIEKNGDFKTQFIETMKKEIVSDIQLSYKKEKIKK